MNPDHTAAPSTPDPAPLAEGRLRVGLAGEGALRWAVADVTKIVETARPGRAAVRARPGAGRPSGGGPLL